jgi:hypothetical protein
MVVLALLLVRTARAGDERIPARAPTLPDLTHRDGDLTLEEILASVSHSDGAVQGTTYIRVERLSFEMPIARSNWYVGAAYDAALGHDDDGSPRPLSGDPELFGRGVWSSAYGLSFGGGLAAVIPTKSYALTDPAASTAYAAVAARSWDRALFDPDDVTLRPFLDVRLLTGPITVQYRQALELATDFSSYRFAAVGTLYFGLRFSPLLSAGVDLIEYYRLEPGLDDDARPYFAVGAHMRIDTRYFHPTLGLMTNIGSPLNALSRLGAPITGAPTSFVGLHVGLSFSLPLPHSHPKEP